MTALFEADSQLEQLVQSGAAAPLLVTADSDNLLGFADGIMKVDWKDQDMHHQDAHPTRLWWHLDAHDQGPQRALQP